MHEFRRAAVPLVLLLLVGCRNPVFDWSGRAADDDRTEFAEWAERSPRDHSPDRDEHRGRRETRHHSRAGSRDDAIARLLDEAHAAVARGDAERAEGLYRRVLLEDDRNPEARHRLAILADQRGDFRDAEEHYLIAMVGKPRDPDVLSDAGYSYLLQERPIESERYLKQALEIAPEHARAANNLGMLYARMGNAERAFAMFRRTAPDAEARRRVAEAMSGPSAPNLAATRPGVRPDGPRSETSARPSWDEPLSTPPLPPPDATTDELAAAMRAARLRAESSRQRGGVAGESWEDPRFAADTRSGFGAPPPRRQEPARSAHSWNGEAEWDRQSVAAVPRDAPAEGIRHAAYAPENRGRSQGHIAATHEWPSPGHAVGRGEYGGDTPAQAGQGPIITPRSERRSAADAASDSAARGAFADARHSTQGGPAEPSAPASSQPDLWPHQDIDVTAPTESGGHPGSSGYVSHRRGSDRHVVAEISRAEAARPAGAARFGEPYADRRSAGAVHASATAPRGDARRAAARVGLAGGPGAMLPVIEFDPVSHPRSAQPNGAPQTAPRTPIEQPRQSSFDTRQPQPWSGRAASPPAGIQPTPRWNHPREAEPAHRLNEYHERAAVHTRRIEELERELAAERARLVSGGGPARTEYPDEFAPRSYSPAEYPVLQPANVRRP